MHWSSFESFMKSLTRCALHTDDTEGAEGHIGLINMGIDMDIDIDI